MQSGTGHARYQHRAIQLACAPCSALFFLLPPVRRSRVRWLLQKAQPQFGSKWSGLSLNGRCQGNDWADPMRFWLARSLHGACSPTQEISCMLYPCPLAAGRFCTPGALFLSSPSSYKGAAHHHCRGATTSSEYTSTPITAKNKAFDTKFPWKMSNGAAAAAAAPPASSATAAAACKAQ